MKQIFYTIKDATGTLRPMTFIVRESMIELEQPKLEQGDELVKVELTEVK